MRRSGQLEIEFETWGGKRRGSGGKRRGRRMVPHRRREGFASRYPSHITLRFIDGVPTMRRDKAFRAIRAAMYVVMKHAGFRIVHLSIQRNHVHMICEASDRTALARGIQGFKISAARKLNKVLGRNGSIFADRYHAELLTTPMQVRNAICYCLNNWRRHGEDRGATVRVDHFSTGYWFDGWKERGPLQHVPSGAEILPSCRAQTWLLDRGFRKAPPISLHERPGPRPDARA
jgi:REP element-mobilizing transposase RayT